MVPTIDQVLKAHAALSVERLVALEQLAGLQADNQALRARITELELERDNLAAALKVEQS